MSSNDPRRSTVRSPSATTWSIATRLTLWYASSAFLLVAIATGLLYLALVRNVDRGDDQFLVDTVQILRGLLRERPDDLAALKQEVEWEDSARRYARVYVRILDQGGRVITETPGATRILESHHPAAIASDAEPESGADFTTEAGTPFRAVAAWARLGSQAGDDRLVQVALDRTAAQQLLGEYRTRLWSILGLALFATVAVGHMIARRGVQPIAAITKKATGIRSSTLHERIELVGLPAELSSLATTFNQMLGRLGEAFARLSTFSADLAHELRTPINNVRGEIEVALRRPRSADEYREALESVLEECGRVSTMIDGLMFLARAESPETEIVRAPVDVRRELQSVCDLYEPSAAEQGVTIETEDESHALVAALDRTLFQRAVTNLVTNALTHTRTGGRVRLSATGTDGELKVQVADTGVGIPAEHLARVVDRFYRVDASRSLVSGGLGLGLAIVQSIVKVHGGSMELASEEGRGTTVRLSFPAALVETVITDAAHERFEAASAES